MDAELLQGFIEEAQSYLPTIRQGIELYAGDCSRTEDLKTAYRQVHTIKGAALMVGLAEIGAFAKTFQDELDEIVSAKAFLSKAQAADFFNKTALLEEMFANIELSVEPEAPENFESGKSENFSFEESLFEIPPSRIETVFSVGGFEIDKEMLEVFALEAEEHLRTITANLNLLEQNPNNREALLEIRRSSHTLKGSAGIVGFQKLSALAHVQEDLLDYLAENETGNAVDNKAVVKILMASTDCLEALSAGKDSPELEQKIAEIIAGFRQVLAQLKASELPGVAETEIPMPTALNEFKTPETPNEIQMPVIQTPAALTASEPKIEAVESPEIHQTSPEIHQTQSSAAQNRAVIRVSLERFDDLVKLVSAMVVSRSAFEQRLSNLKRQVEELHHSTRRLQRLSGKIETDFGAAGNAHLPPPQSYSFAKEPVYPFDSPGEEFDLLEFDRYTEFNQTTRELVETTSDTSAINSEMDNLVANLSLLFDTQRSLFDEMQDKLIRLRMVPLSTLESRLQRTVRVAADEEGKSVDLTMDCDNLEIDSEILHVIVEPLLHLLRNAVAHGIESAETRQMLGKPSKGLITLRAYSEGTHIILNVTDDGRGIVAAALKKKAAGLGFISPSEAAMMSEEDAFSLIFLPGLSTSTSVNQVSGRGVGMNVVKSSIMRQQGSISVKSVPQKGTSFMLRVPTTLAITRVLLVKSSGQTFAFPLKIVRRVTEISQKDFETAKRENSLNINGKNYGLAHLNELLGLPLQPAPPENARVLLLLIETSENPYALAIEQILKPEEIVIKPLGNPLKSVPEFLGATILGDGSVVPVLDLIPLLQKSTARMRKQRPPVENRKPKTEFSVLIVDDSPSVRQINSKIVKNAGWQVLVAKDGLEALETLQAASELPDVILTDVEMPRMDGYELLATLRRQERLRRIPVVMITSRAGEKHRRKAFDLGVSEYLTKPYEDNILLDKIKTLANFK
ncbi:MAG TPA: response regulator [Pyrinomonadaceae bacterium]|jgi:chemosensory pili system protein ChpA (sensor histidine kinase/response regulator)